MKYRILPFIFVILLGGCKTKHSNDDKVVTATDSISQNIRTGGLFDSIHDARLRREVSKDSIELLFVKHVVINANSIEQILYIDHSSGSNEQLVQIANNIPPVILDSPVIRLNSVPEMNGKYVQVYSYKGKFLTAFIGDAITSAEMVIEDSAMTWIPDGFDLLVYKSGERSGDKVTYIVSEQSGQTDTIEMKMLHDSLKIQVWKWPDHGSEGYLMMVPIDKVRYLPAINADNNTGLDGNMEVIFDHINYDSLMNSK